MDYFYLDTGWSFYFEVGFSVYLLRRDDFYSIFYYGFSFFYEAEGYFTSDILFDDVTFC